MKLSALALSALAITSTALSAVPAQATPLWAWAVANSQCKYMRAGVPWEKSMKAALADNSHHLDEMEQASRLGVAGTAITIAVKEQCPKVLYKVYGQHQKQQQQKAAPAVNAITRVGDLVMASQTLMAKGEMGQACVKATEANKLQAAYNLGTSRPLQYALTSCAK